MKKMIDIVTELRITNDGLKSVPVDINLLSDTAIKKGIKTNCKRWGLSPDFSNAMLKDFKHNRNSFCGFVNNETGNLEVVYIA